MIVTAGPPVIATLFSGLLPSKKPHDGADDVREILALERRLPDERLVEHAAERPHVTAAIRRSAFGLLRRHVRRGPKNGAGLRRGKRQRR